MSNYSFTVKRYKVYFNGSQVQSGVADVVTPKITFPKVTIDGAGIAGQLSVPVSGMPTMSATTITWHAPSQQMYSTFSGVSFSVSLQSSIFQYNNNGTSGSLPALTTVPEIIEMVCVADEVDPGRREASNKATASVAYSPLYLMIQMGGQTYVEVDPMNGVCILNGVDVNSGDGI
jgi:uncharacterized protein